MRDVSRSLRPARPAPWLVLLVLAAAGGCGNVGDDSAAGAREPAPAPAGPAPAPPVVSDPAPPAGSQAPAPIDPVPPAGPGEDRPSRTTGTSGADATHHGEAVPILRALRVGEQPGADRLVFEFDGVGLPAWSVEYVDRPVYECGSGDAVRLPGDAWLQVRFIGARAHTEAGEGTTGPKLRTFDHANLLALARTCDFEGEVTWVAAVRRPEGYTPLVLDAPARLVVDIAH